MAIIRIQIRKTDDEWKFIEDVIKKKYEDRNLSLSKKGYNQFFRIEINKLFQDIQIGDCVDIPKTHTKKGFSIRVSDNTKNKITCRANKLNISPGTLLTRMILDPCLL